MTDHPLDTDSLGELTFVAFDTETTGLSPIACRLVELCAVKFTLAGPEGASVETFERLINPGQSISAELSAIHGITDAMVKDAPIRLKH